MALLFSAVLFHFRFYPAPASSISCLYRLFVERNINNTPTVVYLHQHACVYISLPTIQRVSQYDRYTFMSCYTVRLYSHVIESCESDCARSSGGTSSDYYYVIMMMLWCNHVEINWRCNTCLKRQTLLQCYCCLTGTQVSRSAIG